ncbi:MAG: hypothetical protein AAGD14_01530 [Planctomycetota bacterium]
MVLRPRSVLIALLLLAAAAPAEEVRRYVLALVPGKGPDPRSVNGVHELAENPLNYLGLLVRHHYIENGPPDEAALADVRGVLTWFEADTPDPGWLWAWLEKEVPARRLRVVHFNEFGPLAADAERLGRWLERFGLAHQQIYVQGAHRLEAVFRDRELCAYEADPSLRPVLLGPKNASEANQVWVTVRTRSEPKFESHPVVTGPWGAVALRPWTVRSGSESEDRRWYLQPFQFFREAFGCERLPAPHPSVLNGRRKWFLQIDGDGFESLSTIRQGPYAAEIMMTDVLERYPLPYTVSIVVRSLATDFDVAEPTPKMLLARRMFAMPNVEVASHGVLHTLRWAEDLTEDAPPRTIMWYRSMENYEYSQVNEVKESIRFINERLVTPPKKCEVMLWTGYANPLEDALAQAAKSGCWNLNGGVFRWDPWYDSVGYVSAWGRRTGRALQVYAGAANENDFQGFFDTMPVSFRHIDKTIERTGNPRILKPADIYIHFYSAEKPARLLPTHLLIQRWALEEPTAPVFGSTYARAVVSAVETARIERRADGWEFRDFGDCRSVRIDDEPRSIDLARSRNILGYKRDGRRLRIHLAKPDATLVFGEPERLHPYVEEANCLLDDADIGARGVAVTAHAHNARVIVFAGLPPEAALLLHLDGAARTVKSDADGRCTVRLPEPGKTRVVLVVPE